MKKFISAVLTLCLLAPLASVLSVMAVPAATSPAWYMFPAEENSRDTITYDELTALCLAAGLPENPYPPPTTYTDFFDSTNKILYRYGASSYHVFTLTIGGDVFEGVSCDVYDMDYNLKTGKVHMAYEATWYLGKLGKMNNGFVGTVDLTFYGYKPTTPESYDYFVISYAMEGFDRFNKHTVVLNGDTRVSPAITGYCLTLGNRHK